MTLVAGIACTESTCTVLVRDVASGRVMRSGAARHQVAAEVHPGVWWDALQEAVARAGGLQDVSAVSLVGTAHSVVFLDGDGAVIGPSPVGVAAHRAATHLITEVGTGDLIERVGQAPGADSPAAVIRWWCEAHPDAAARLAAVALPHEWLAWRLRGGGAGHDPAEMVTDRSSASLTGLFGTAVGRYDAALVRLVAGRDIRLPRALLPGELGGRAADGLVVAPGASHAAASALGLAMRPGDAVLRLDSRGCVSAVWSGVPVAGHAHIAYLADADAHLLPTVSTSSAARTIATAAEVLGVDGSGFAALALQAPPGSGGTVFAAGAVSGLDAGPGTRSRVARAVIEGCLVEQAHALVRLRDAGVSVDRVLLTGAAARNAAVMAVAPTVLDYAIEVPLASEHALDGAAAQAAWVLHGGRPAWVPAMAARLEPDVDPRIAAAHDAAAGRWP